MFVLSKNLKENVKEATRSQNISLNFGSLRNSPLGCANNLPTRGVGADRLPPSPPPWVLVSTRALGMRAETPPPPRGLAVHEKRPVSPTAALSDKKLFKFKLPTQQNSTTEPTPPVCREDASASALGGVNVLDATANRQLSSDNQTEDQKN